MAGWPFPGKKLVSSHKRAQERCAQLQSWLDRALKDLPQKAFQQFFDCEKHVPQDGKDRGTEADDHAGQGPASLSTPAADMLARSAGTTAPATERTLQISIPLNQGAIGIKMDEHGVVTRSRDASAAAGLPVGGRVVAVNGVPATSKTEISDQVKHLVSEGATSMLLSVLPESPSSANELADAGPSAGSGLTAPPTTTSTSTVRIPLDQGAVGIKMDEQGVVLAVRLVSQVTGPVSPTLPLPSCSHGGLLLSLSFPALIASPRRRVATSLCGV